MIIHPITKPTRIEGLIHVYCGNMTWTPPPQQVDDHDCYSLLRRLCWCLSTHVHLSDGPYILLTIWHNHELFPMVDYTTYYSFKSFHPNFFIYLYEIILANLISCEIIHGVKTDTESHFPRYWLRWNFYFVVWFISLVCIFTSLSEVLCNLILIIFILFVWYFCFYHVHLP